MILALIGFGLILFGLVQLFRGVIRLIKSVYYKRFAREKAIDRGYEKYILKQSTEYKNFKKNVNKEINDLING